MKKILLFLVILNIVIVCFAAEEVAVAYKVKNEISMQRDEQKQELKQGDLLEDGDKLISGDKSFAAIKFVDGSSIVKLFPNSVIRVSAKKNGKLLDKRSFLESGKVFSKIKKKMGKFEIETATSVASVKGTEFIIEVGEDGTTTITTITGEVVLYNKASDTSSSVPAGQQGVSTPSGDVGTQPYNPEDISDEVQDEIDETKHIEIQMQNSDGDVKTIKIEME